MQAMTQFEKKIFQDVHGLPPALQEKKNPGHSPVYPADIGVENTVTFYQPCLAEPTPKHTHWKRRKPGWEMNRILAAVQNDTTDKTSRPSDSWTDFVLLQE